MQGQQNNPRYRYPSQQNNNQSCNQPRQNYPQNRFALPTIFTQRAVYCKSLGVGQNYYGKSFNNQQIPSDHQRGWGKRSHEQVAVTPPISPTSSHLNTSSSPKRQVQKQNSIDLKPIKQKPKSKGIENSPANVIQTQKEKEWTQLFEYTIKQLEVCKPGEEVNTLLFHLQSPRSSCITIKERISSELARLMLTLGVKEIMVFGSTLTGLDFMGSDLDFHIQLITQPISDDHVRKVIQLAGKITRFDPCFRVICSIVNARVPIIRLFHQETKTTCDINFTSKFGCYNSCFIGQVLSYDTRIKDLAVIIKLWAKAHKIAEKMVMSNYCLLMLMIFYLQNLEEPMLHTIKDNQEGKRKMILDAKYKWNVFFNDSINKTKETHLTSRQLLVGFFEFYHKLNYCNYIISLYNGDLVHRRDFDTHPDFAEYRQIVALSKLPPLKFDNPQMLVVQDGFELNLNVGIKYARHLDHFCALIKASHDLCKDSIEEPMSTLLVKLFTGLKVPESEIPRRNNERKKKRFHMKIHAIAGDLKVTQTFN